MYDLVTVEGRATDDTIAPLTRGVIVAGEKLRAEAAVIRKASARESHLTITLTEGRNREIRRLLATVGHPVTRRRRVQFGGLELGTLAPGRWRALSTQELRRAFPAYYPRERAPIPK